MKKHLLFLAVASLFTFSLVGTAVAEGPPFPATVIDIEEGSCTAGWLDSDLNQIVLYGGGMGVITGKTGNWSLTCTFSVDLDDPGLATIAQLCGVFPEFCNGNGSASSVDVFPCFLNDLVSDTNRTLITPSGVYKITCHFNGAKP